MWHYDKTYDTVSKGKGKMKKMITQVILRLRICILQQGRRLQRLLPASVAKKIETIGGTKCLDSIRNTAKIVLVSSVVICLFAGISARDPSATMRKAAVDLEFYQNRMNSLRDEVEEKTGLGSSLGLFVESFFNGFTFGALDPDGFNGPSKRLEKWARDVRSRRDEYQLGIDTANAELKESHENLAAYSTKIWLRNVMFVIAVLAALSLLFVRKPLSERDDKSDA